MNQAVKSDKQMIERAHKVYVWVSGKHTAFGFDGTYLKISKREALRLLAECPESFYLKQTIGAGRNGDGGINWIIWIDRAW